MDEDDSIAAEAANKPLPFSSSSPTQFPEHDISSSRPSTAYRVTRRIPEGDEDEELSTTPTKEQFHHASSTPIRSQYSPSPSEPQTAIRSEHNPPARSPLARHTSIEASGNDLAEEASVQPGNNSNNDSFTEQVVRKHLQEIESSFAAPLSPLPTMSHQGLDDTFLFDSPSKMPKAASTNNLRSPMSHSSPALHHDEPSLPPISERNEDNKTPRLKQEGFADPRLNVPENTSALEAFSSSPTGAATARTISRVMSSRAGSSRNEPDSDNRPAADGNDSSFLRPNQPADDSMLHAGYTSANTSGHTWDSISRDNSDLSVPEINVDVGSTPGNALKGGKRPKYLRSRITSHRSSSSDFTTDDIDSDVTTGTAGTAGLGADYALQSGGAVPTLGMTRSMSNILTRQISMGSMASDFKVDSTGRVAMEMLEPMEEDEDVPANDHHLRTPKAPRQPLTAPTDTVIARHVRNVHVPESLAREYKTKSGFVTPHRKLSEVNLATSTTSNRTGKNFTLKEQSSTIERLSKENFDLKLKVMFLSDRLDKLSEEGIKEMISENVDLKTNLAVIQRDNKVLRRRVKELERQQKDDNERPSTAKSGGSSNGQTDFDQHANDEELFYLRERVDEFVTEVERLKEEVMNKEAEKRRMAEILKSMQTVNERSVGDSLGQQDETDVWKDLYSQETARREQADDDNRKLRDEVFRLKQEAATGGSNAGGSQGGILHTTNIYNITKKPRNQSPTRPVSGMSGDAATLNGAMSVGSTLVDELRRESEQLRHENAELRREVGAQTSMLTSRNREKERLYQEIEDLKMAQRRGTAPSTIDSILDRSASRAGVRDRERPQSRASGGTRATTTLEDPEREELETKMAEVRDKLNQAKMQNQDLQREISACMEDFEAEMEARKQAEAVAHQLEEELQGVVNDLMTFQQERDEALQENSVLDHEFHALQKEAQDEIDALEGEADQKDGEIARLTQEVTERNENQDALQEEMRKLSDVLLRFEDQQDQQLKRIQELEHELAEANKELEELEAKLLEANDKAQRLSVQQESSQGEIAFLREEQEGDKIRIGELEASIGNAEQNIREEKDRVKELDNRLQTERRQREMVANQEKEDVQQFVNQLNREMSAAKDESRKLRKNLSKQEVEAAEWKERLLELENNLREALGDLNGTRSSFLRDITKLQHDLENTCRELDSARASVMEKDRIIKQRDELLESHALESRRVGDMLTKEQQNHRNTKHQFETFQKTHQHVTRNMSSAEIRIIELENAKNQDKQRIVKLESSLKEQLNERNSLLLVLWTRLSSLCGTDWAHNNSLINGRALPSLEAVANMLPGFSKNLLAAVKTIESIVGTFQGRIGGVEKQLWKEYENLEQSLDKRIKKLDKVESMVRNGVATRSISVSGAASQAILEETRQRMEKLEDAYRQIKVENAALRSATELRARTAVTENFNPHGDRNFSQSPSPSIPTGPRDRAYRSVERSSSSSQRRIPSSASLQPQSRKESSRTSTMTRAHTAGALLTTNDFAMASDMAEDDRVGYHSNDAHSQHSGHSGGHSGGHSNNHNNNISTNNSGGGGGGGGDMKWMHRLKDLELKLKAEREGRLMDRNEASKKILSLEEVALQAQAREAKLERRRKMEAASAQGKEQGGGGQSGSGRYSGLPGSWGLRGE